MNSSIRVCRVPSVNFVFFSARSASSSRGSLRCAALGVGSAYLGNEYFGRGGGVVGIMNALEKEIDKRVVFLGGRDDQRDPAERETSRCLRPGHFLSPSPSVPPTPAYHSHGQSR